MKFWDVAALVISPASYAAYRMSGRNDVETDFRKFFGFEPENNNAENNRPANPPADNNNRPVENNNNRPADGPNNPPANNNNNNNRPANGPNNPPANNNNNNNNGPRVTIQAAA